MNMRWLAAGIAAVLITGGAATLAQRAITQKTRGVLPDGTEAAHADTRVAAKPVADRPPISFPDKPTLALGSLSPPVEGLAPAAAEPELIPPPPTVPSGPVAEATPVAQESPAPMPQESPAVPAVVAAVPAEASPEPGATPVDPGPAATDPAVNAASTDSPAPIRMPSGRRPRAVVADPTPVEPAAPAESAAAKADPVQSVEEFVERNRKEAEQAIQDLSAEAEDLKSRLAKVETALVRWHSFSRALKADQPASQTEVPDGGKSNWKKPEPAAPHQPVKPEGPAADPGPAPATPEGPAPAQPGAEPAPTTPSPEVPAASTLPPPAEPSIPPADARPTDVPTPVNAPPSLPEPAPEPKPGS